MDHIRPHILVTGGGAPGAYGILRALQSSDVKTYSCDIRSDVIGKQFSDGFFTVPAGDDPHYIEALLAQCKTHQISLIIPITTRELIPLSKHINAFESIGCKIMLSKTAELEIANHKCALYQHLSSQNIRTPDFKIAKTSTEFKSAVEDLLDQYGRLAFKPCQANGSRGFRIIDPAVDEMNLLLNEKPNNSFVEKDKAVSLFENNTFPPMVLSQYLADDEYSIDCLLNHGEILAVVPRKRLKINNGISVEGVIEKNEVVIAYVEEILNSLELHGPIGVQVKMHEGKPYILEINPRLQGTTTAGIEAGFNLVELAVQLASGQISDRQSIESGILWGKHFVRYYKEGYIN